MTQGNLVAYGDTIMMYEDHADEIEPTIHMRGTLDYMQFLGHYWMQRFGFELPAVPDNPQMNARAVVNHGRWIAGCAGCYSGLPLSRNHNVTICPRCGSGGWARVVYPDNRLEIERELLNQPGHRLFAPFRNWVPSWSMEHLRQRTEAANRQLREGIANPRAASIGTPRIWSVGEILTASNMNTYLSEIDRDLIGTNGPIELLHGVRPGSFTNTQLAALTGVPDGTLFWNETASETQVYDGTNYIGLGVVHHLSDALTFSTAATDRIRTITHNLGKIPIIFQFIVERLGSTQHAGWNQGDQILLFQMQRTTGGESKGVYDITTTQYKLVIDTRDIAIPSIENGEGNDVGVSLSTGNYGLRIRAIA